MFRRTLRSCSIRSATRRPDRRRKKALSLELLESRQLLTTMTVDTFVDELDGSIVDGDTSLRDAIAVANATPGTDTINFDGGLAGGTLTLTIGEMLITDSVTINGLGADQMTIDGGGQSRIFFLDDGTSDEADVEVSDVTLTGGFSDGAGFLPDSGGAIFSYENLSIHRSVITGNEASSSGGGIAVWIGSSLDVVDSTISNNSAGLSGGGVYGRAAFSFTNSTISGNSANHRGGGMYMVQATVNFRHSTIVGNTADADSSGSGNGGGARFKSSTTVDMSHTIVARNSDNTLDAPDLSFATSPITVRHSLIGDSTGSGLTESPIGVPDTNGNLIGGITNGVIDPLLGPLQDNGGTAPTHELLSGSPAIDAGDVMATAGVGNVPQFDQRGNPLDRVVGTIDMGAFEVQQAAIDGDFNDDGDLDGDDIDMLVENIAIGPADPAMFDLTGDGLVNLADRDQWLALAGAMNLPSGNPYLVGDANLDGTVDGQDFIVWNVNKFTTAAAWTRADFNADGSVDGQDFILWNDIKFTSADNQAQSGNVGRPVDNHVLAGKESRRRNSENAVTMIDAVFAELVQRSIRCLD